MTVALPQRLTLEQFLTLPYIEESPAWEFVQGEVTQKPMPGGKHSRIQSRLVSVINNAVDSPYEALTELRCTVGGRSIVPDIAVLKHSQLPADENGEIVSTGVSIAPNWIIEILSPQQSQMKVTRKILHSLRHGGQLGWLIDPEERVVLVYHPDRLPEEWAEDAGLPVLPGLSLSLTPEQLFSWLRINRC
ncbi:MULTISPECIES: Uma2 family endonuclease [Cyanophyceae]|uniref:Uma2 family endonuclease n=1 Tax=Cyanophyceae TaxID=3028117 RepID=UPI0016893480|nr:MULTISPECIES: Uma2 family endonuclease [Cyanophyceae]MBD1914517.1 Uma2 family endonuclease [Phormidium sp. FACHB-77]MBD2031090.1 Uma2 family endonuclease [Phormidium sp. FACHB-322]MBD2052077.1 Uma2 family endonuclease [Leptolyngbya sp. FACHB-60]